MSGGCMVQIARRLQETEWFAEKQTLTENTEIKAWDDRFGKGSDP
jgi:hypothetical protein